jgi:magnesium-transporting ATPase (P-type)
VVGGHGKAEVIATGMETQVGLIAKRLKTDQNQELSPLQKSINLLGSLIGIMCMVVVILSTTAAYLSNFNDPSNPCLEGDDHCLLLSSIERGLMMAVSIIPHGLPFVVMVMMQIGAHEMKKQNALLMRHSAVDYLGATTAICTDKTGTLTEGKMTAKRLFGMCCSGSEGKLEESSLSFYPLRGASPNGGLFTSKDLSPLAMERMDESFDIGKRRQSFGEHGLQDLADASATQESLDALLGRAHLVCGFLTCPAASLREGDCLGQWETQGNMTEAALKVSAAKGGYWNEEGVGRQLLHDYCNDEGLQVPFTSSRKMMATIHKLPVEKRLETLEFPEDTTHLAILKGAPDRLAGRLQQIPGLNGKVIVVPGRNLSDPERALIERRNEDLAREALRSLLLALCPLNSQSVERLRSAPDADARLSILLNHPSLCFLSLWGIYDPPRSMVRKSVEECHEAGIRVVMITGDQPATASAVGKQVGILEENDDGTLHALECTELQEGVPATTAVETRRLSKRASELVEAANVVVQEKRPSIQSADSSRRGSHRLSVHDVRGKADKHEPSYKSEEELAELTSRVSVWARAKPTDKVAIVESLRKQDHITVMTGDGVNDAPALKHAHTGVAMGIAGTEVTRQASSLVLLDDDFSTIVAAVREGRRIYANTQKYLLYNFSVKEGELCCVLFAIMLRVPLPIQGVKTLLNMICTHILPPLVLAYEAPESYAMRIPPRETKRDTIITPLMLFFRWLPYILVLPLGVLGCMSFGIWSHTGFLHSASVIGTSKVGMLDAGLVACEYAGALESDHRFMSDRQPFHCKCNNRWQHTHVEQWGVGKTALLGKVNQWTGETGNMFEKSKTPWAQGIDSFLEECTDANHQRHWCWKDGKALANGRPLLPEGQNCAVYGSRVGQTMGFASIQLSEILSLMCFRTNECICSHLFTNVYYTFAVLFNLSALGVMLYVPRVAETLDFAPLSAELFAITLCFPCAFILFNELTKSVFMRRLEAHHDTLKASQVLDTIAMGKKIMNNSIEDKV